MKKHLLQLASVLFICLAVLSSCEKEDTDSLAGTSWLCETETIIQNGVATGVAIELDFTTATKGKINILVGGISTDAIVISGFEAGEFTYSYSKPTVKITVDGETATGKIDGKKLSIEGLVFEKE